MKYKTFLLLRNVGGVGLAGLPAIGAFLGCRSGAQNSAVATEPRAYNAPAARERTVANPPAKSEQNEAARPAMATGKRKSAEPVPTGAAASLTDRDKQIIALRKEPLSRGKPAGDTTRWLSVGDDFRAEFRADAGSGSWNRVKVDLDGDKKWDEKWDFKTDGSIKRRVSPSDDDNYSAEYRLKSGETKWVRVK